MIENNFQNILKILKNEVLEIEVKISDLKEKIKKYEKKNINNDNYYSSLEKNGVIIEDVNNMFNNILNDDITDIGNKDELKDCDCFEINKNEDNKNEDNKNELINNLLKQINDLISKIS